MAGPEGFFKIGTFVRSCMSGSYASRATSLLFFGRPPSLPLRRAAADLAFVDALPPILPISAAIQRLEPKNPSSSAGK